MPMASAAGSFATAAWPAPAMPISATIDGSQLIGGGAGRDALISLQGGVSFSVGRAPTLSSASRYAADHADMPPIPPAHAASRRRLIFESSCLFCFDWLISLLLAACPRLNT